MDGADGIDSEVVNQVLFKGSWIAAPVEELIPDQTIPGIFVTLPRTYRVSKPTNAVLA